MRATEQRLREALQYAIKQVPELATVPGIAAALSLPATEQASAEQEPLFLLHTGALFGGERDEWDVEANSGRAVDELCDRYPGQTIGLYAAPVSQPAPADQFRDAAQMIGADDKWSALYFHAHRLIDGIGHHGEISSKCDAVEQLERALSDLDGGEYRHGLKPPYQAPDVKPAAVVRSVERGEVRVKWLAGFPQIGDRLFYRSAPADHQPALRTIMRRADGFKEPCGQDPESPAAIRNRKFATIAQVAAQGLGLVNGPALDVPAQLPELSDEVFDVLSMARMALFQYHKLYRLDSEQRLIDRIDAAIAAKKGQPT